jgi:type IV pilus assembly protein PilA
MQEASARKSSFASVIGWAFIIVAVVILFALPKLLGDRMFHHETFAIKTIQTIHTMQVQYKSQYGRFATSLAELGPPASGAPSAAAADLLGKDLASSEKSGYKFTLTGNHDGYAIHANPVKFGPSGTRTFYSDQTLTVYENYGPEPASSTSKALK